MTGLLNPFWFAGAPPGGNGAFTTINLQAVIANGNTSLTLTEGVDFTLESGIASDEWFAFLSANNHTGMGNDSGGGNQNSDDFTVSLTYSGNNIVLTRYGTTGTCEVAVQIIQFTGGGGPNEIKVREKGEVTLAASVGSANVTIPGSVVNNADLVPWITGQRVDDATRNNFHGAAHYTSISAPNVVITRDRTPTSESRCSYALVEFTGSNWTISREEVFDAVTSGGDLNVGTTTATLGTTLNALGETFIHRQWSRSITSASGLDDSSWKTELISTTQIRYTSQATNSDGQRLVTWIIENPDVTVTRYTGAMNGATEPEEVDVTITAVADLAKTMTVMTNDSTGSGTAFPRGQITHRITSTTNVRLRQSDNGVSQDYYIEVIELP